jgi:hypothetical protein
MEKFAFVLGAVAQDKLIQNDRREVGQDGERQRPLDKFGVTTLGRGG